jgi:hypothetical protein
MTRFEPLLIKLLTDKPNYGHTFKTIKKDTREKAEDRY